MSSFVLIPGAGGAKWYWHRVVPLLIQAGHDATAIDFPAADETKGLLDYAEIVLRAIGSRSDVVLVAQSLGGFTAPLVAERTALNALVLVNAMIPLPDETAGDWGRNTGSSEARREAARRNGYSEEFDAHTYFLHDVPEDIVRAGKDEERPQSDSIFAQACRFAAWPEIPIQVLASSEDRLFPIDFQRRVARERLNREVDTIRGGHLVALSNPSAVADRLCAYARR